MSEFHDSKTVKARKPHRCAECGGTIEQGETYKRFAGRYDGDFYAYKLCALCDRAWTWAHSEFDPDPEWCCVGDLPTLISDSTERFEHLRVAEYLRRQWTNRATGERYAFPFPNEAVPTGAASSILKENQ